jgi:hypothetical protein
MITILSLIPNAIIPNPIPSAYNPHQVYLLKITCNKLHYPIYKIGVSTRLSKRILDLKKTEANSSFVKGKGHLIEIELLDSLWVEDCHQASYIEHLVMSNHIKYKYRGKYILPNGNSELFWCLPGLTYIRYGKVIEASI